MKVYELRYQCEGARDGFAAEYYPSKRKALKALGELNRRPSADVVPDTAKIRPLIFKGTPKQMVLAALRCNA